MRKAVTAAGWLAVLALGASAGGDAPPRVQRERALTQLVQAEKDFVALAGTIGWRKAFLATFAEEAVIFQPGPVRAHEALPRLPPEVDESQPEWHPILSDVSAAGDLGFNLGPYSWSFPAASGKPPGYGTFFTIWKRQPDGRFKVVLDFGAGSPTPVGGHRKWRALRRAAAAGKAKAGNLADAEAALGAAVSRLGLVKAYAAVLDPDAVLLRADELPLDDPVAIRKHLAKAAADGAPGFVPDFVDVAASSDLGYSYGHQTLTTGEATARSAGYYVHVWRRGPRGDWRLAVDVLRAEPPPAP
jgi:ketosteroid isomerase-like protein